MMMKTRSQVQSVLNNREGPLYPLVEEFQAFRQSSLNRKQEVQELINLLSQRAIAEQEYAKRMIHISSSFNSFKTGLLAKEVEAFKMDCHHKGTAAEMLADSISTECVFTLTQLLQKHDVEFKGIMNESELVVGDILSDNSELHDLALKYSRTCQHTEQVIKDY